MGLAKELLSLRGKRLRCGRPCLLQSSLEICLLRRKQGSSPVNSGDLGLLGKLVAVIFCLLYPLI